MNDVALRIRDLIENEGLAFEEAVEITAVEFDLSEDECHARYQNVD